MSFSERPSPYTSAVSRNVTPESTAAPSTSSAASSDTDPQSAPSCQHPSPTTPTDRPVRPSSLLSMDRRRYPRGRWARDEHPDRRRGPVLPGRCNDGVGAGRRPAQPRALDPADPGVARRAGARGCHGDRGVGAVRAARVPRARRRDDDRPLRPARSARSPASRRSPRSGTCSRGTRRIVVVPAGPSSSRVLLERGRLPGGPAPPPTHRRAGLAVPRRHGAIRAAASPARGSRNRSPRLASIYATDRAPARNPR